MAAPLNTLRQRFGYLTEIVDLLDSSFNKDFDLRDPKSNDGTANKFLAGYTGIIDTLDHITKEKYKDGVDQDLDNDLNRLFKRTVEILPKAAKHVRKLHVKLVPVHKELLEATLRLRKRADCSGDMFTYALRMNTELEGIRPPPRAAWNEDATDFKPSEEFEGVFEDFGKLEKDPHNRQQRYEFYATRSARLLQSALHALRLPEYFMDPEEETFFANETRPTYVEYPYGSEEFLYGTGSRPGILSVKMKLGAPLTKDEQSKVDKATEKTTPKPVKTYTQKAKSLKTPVNKGKAKEAGQSKGPKKRPSKSKTQDQARKKPRTGWGYFMGIVNAAADVEDVLRDSKFMSAKDPDTGRPDSNRLVTPTVETRRNLLARYRDDYIYIIDEIYKRRFGTPDTASKLPQTAVERKTWLETADKEVTKARDNVKSLIETTTTNAKAKQLRLEAYRLKLARAMYTLGLLSGYPAASEAEIKAGLKARLDDWILYEEAWNASELVNLERAGVSQQLWDKISEDVKKRVDNIQQWLEMWDEVDSEESDQDRDGHDVDDADTFQSPFPDPAVDDAEDEGYEEEVEEEQEEEEEEDDVDAMDIDSDPDPDVIEVDNPPKKNNAAAQGMILTEEEIYNGEVNLDRVLNPQIRPNAEDYLLDVREENRRRNWFRGMAEAEYAGQSSPPWTSGRSFNIYAAGGPPGWENMPLDTAWERMQYMWVLTYWRFFQLRELDR
ncbi:hypothetical protein RRF57_010551 [Xylaria bambusicola]|uniref:Uncharacterized protein n=1 Tax=Xylaria bambusicola TaxID=326684 RepID=A0AAN7ZD25_9PEZI